MDFSENFKERSYKFLGNITSVTDYDYMRYQILFSSNVLTTLPTY